MPSKDIDKRRKWARDWARKHKEQSSQYRRGIHPRVIATLGGVCVYCGCDDVTLLEVNHKNGGGRKELHENDKRSFYISVINGKRSTVDLEVACRVCNAYHAMVNLVPALRASRSKRIVLHDRVTSFLGGKCKECGCTNLDHLEISSVKGNRPKKAEEWKLSSEYEPNSVGWLYSILRGEQRDLQVLCKACNARYHIQSNVTSSGDWTMRLDQPPLWYSAHGDAAAAIRTQV